MYLWFHCVFMLFRVAPYPGRRRFLALRIILYNSLLMIGEIDVLVGMYIFLAT